MGSVTGPTGEATGVIRTAEMPPEMAESALKMAEEAVKVQTTEKDIAAVVKKRMDETHGPTWHVIAGRNFGSWVSHEHNRFVYLYAGKYALLIFKSA